MSSFVLRTAEQLTAEARLCCRSLLRPNLWRCSPPPRSSLRAGVCRATRASVSMNMHKDRSSRESPQGTVYESAQVASTSCTKVARSLACILAPRVCPSARLSSHCLEPLYFACIRSLPTVSDRPPCPLKSDRVLPLRRLRVLWQPDRASPTRRISHTA